MIEILKKYKWCILFLFVILVVFIFCHFQTFIINDDLPYSLYFRADNRITNIIEIVKNQIYDYSHISPRIFIHFIVQFLLIFDKNLWSILNPIIIILIIILMSYIVYELTFKKTKYIYMLVASTVMFLLLYNYKYLIYWVAGSINYVWIFLLCLLVILYYLKIGFTKKPLMTFLISLIFACLCEATAVFMIVLLLTDLFIKLFVQKEDKKEIIKYLIYIFGAFLGFCFLMLAPSNLGRMTGNEVWNSLNLFEKISTSLPVISNNLFNVFNIYNLYPLMLLVSIIYYLRNDKCLKWFIICAGLFMLLSFVSSWSWLAFGILFLVFQCYIFVKNDDFKLIGVLLGGYAVLYSLAITPEYNASRTGFHLSLIMGMFTLYNFIYLNDMSRCLKILFFALLFITIILEVVIYSYIGFIKNKREEALDSVMNGESKVLNLKEIKAPFNRFHIDPNSPADKQYWAYQAFIDYYDLPEDISIKIVE